MDQLKNYFEKLDQTAKKQNVQLEMLVTGRESLSLGFQKKKLEKY